MLLRLSGLCEGVRGGGEVKEVEGRGAGGGGAGWIE